MPYALREAAEKETDQLVDEGILESVDCSEYGSTIVPVLKMGGEIRLRRLEVDPKPLLEGRPTSTAKSRRSVSKCLRMHNVCQAGYGSCLMKDPEFW